MGPDHHPHQPHPPSQRNPYQHHESDYPDKPGHAERKAAGRRRRRGDIGPIPSCGFRRFPRPSFTFTRRGGLRCFWGFPRIGATVIGLARRARCQMKPQTGPQGRGGAGYHPLIKQSP
jgi:hypothetical protein